MQSDQKIFQFLLLSFFTKQINPEIAENSPKNKEKMLTWSKKKMML